MVFCLSRPKPVHVFDGKTIPINILSLNISNGRDLKFHSVPQPTPQIKKVEISILVTITDLSYCSTKEPCPTKWPFVPQFAHLYNGNKNGINLIGLLRTLSSFDLI